LPIPDWPWQDISIDIITSLPNSNSFDAIWVVINYLTKLRDFTPYLTMIDTEGLAELFLSNIIYLYRLQDIIVSD
jgi:hypothetical protein